MSNVTNVNIDAQARQLLPALLGLIQGNIGLEVGQSDGIHVGSRRFIYNASRRVFWEATDSANVSFASAGGVPGSAASWWLRFGYEGEKNIQLKTSAYFSRKQIRIDRELLQGENVFDVSTYGASPSATAATNATAFAAAISACPQFGTVMIPAGSYNYDTTLAITRDHITLMSNGGTAQLLFTGTGNCLNISNHHCTLNGLYIAPTVAGANAGHGIYMSDAYWAHLIDVTVTGAQYDCISAVGSWSLLAEGSAFEVNTADATYCGFRLGADSNNMGFYRCRFYAGSNRTGCIVEHGANIHFDACDFSGASSTSVGLAVDECYGLTLSDCYAEALYRTVWLGFGSAQPVGVTITGTYIGMGTLDNAIGILVDGCYEAVIDGNTILGGGGQASVGIQVTGDDLSVFGLRIARQYIYGMATPVSDPKGRADNTYARRVTYGAAVPTDGGVWQIGDIVWNSAPTTGEPTGWACTTAGWAVVGAWANSTAYAATSYVIGADNKLYYTVAGGTSNGTAPTDDAGVTWVEKGTGGAQSVWEPIGHTGTRSGTADPTGAVTPHFLGELYLDVSNTHVYIAQNTTNTGWLALV